MGGYLKSRVRQKVAVAPSPNSRSRTGRFSRRREAARLKWLAIDGIVEELRAVKDADEIDQIQNPARVGSQVMEEAIALVRPGVSELDMPPRSDIACGGKGLPENRLKPLSRPVRGPALPHAQPTARRIGRNELVVLDLGAILRRYCSDLTRTVHVGKASTRTRQWYGAVLDAQQAAIAALKAGVTLWRCRCRLPEACCTAKV